MAQVALMGGMLSGERAYIKIPDKILSREEAREAIRLGRALIRQGKEFIEREDSDPLKIRGGVQLDLLGEGDE